MENPQIESPNVMHLDYADNPKLRDVFTMREIGDEVKIKFVVCIMGKYPEGVKLGINKVITEGNSEYDTEKKEIEPDTKEPVMASIHSSKRTKRGVEGPHGEEAPHGRPPQTARNSQEQWMTAYT